MVRGTVRRGPRTNDLRTGYWSHGKVVADPTGVMKTTVVLATVLPVFWALTITPG